MRQPQTFYHLALTASYERIDVSLAYPLTTTAPLYIPLWAYIFLGERLSATGIFGILVARALDRWWEELGRPARFTVVEAGVGSAVHRNDAGAMAAPGATVEFPLGDAVRGSVDAGEVRHVTINDFGAAARFRIPACPSTPPRSLLLPLYADCTSAIAVGYLQIQD